jgi:hypothetical protein
VKIEKGLVDSEAMEGKDTVFECSISKAKWKKTGSDIPVRWLKNEREIKSGAKYSMELVDCVHRLKIKQLDFDDQSSYSLVIGTDKSTANLKINGRTLFSMVC